MFLVSPALWRHVVFLSHFLIFCDINWAHRQDWKTRNTFLLLTECTKVSKQSPTHHCIDYRTERIHILIASFPLFLSIWRWKDLSCCFLLLHYLSPCGALIAGFISDFAGCFLGKPLKCVSDSKQSFSRFFALAPVASSLMVNPPLHPLHPWIFKANWATLWSQNPFNTVLRKGDVVLVSWLTWKENRGSSLSLALLASLAQYGWTSNDWLGVICVAIEATWVLLYVLHWRLLHWEWGGRVLKTADVFRIQPLDGGATPGSNWDRLEVGRNYWDILEIWGYFKPHNHNLKQVFSIPVLINITKLHTPSEIFWYIYVLHIYLSHTVSAAQWKLRYVQSETKEEDKARAANLAVQWKRLQRSCCGGFLLQTWNDSNGWTQLNTVWLAQLNWPPQTVW